MRAIPVLLTVSLLAVGLAGCTSPDTPGATGGEAACAEASSGEVAADEGSRPVVRLATNHGDIDIELFSERTPITAQNFLDLAESGFYDGVKFHRVIDGFMIQGGDPLTKDDAQQDRWGTGGPGYQIPDEFHPELRHDGPGLLSMAKSPAPNTGGSQFFITLGETPHLDDKHSIFGYVVEGMDVVREIGKVPTDGNPPEGQNRPLDPVVIEAASVLEPRALENPTRGVGLLAVDCSLEAEPGRDASFITVVKNEGTLLDTYDLALTGLPSGWTVANPDDLQGIQVPARTGRAVVIELDAADGAKSGAAKLKVTSTAVDAVTTSLDLQLDAVTLDGPEAEETATVTVHYLGVLEDGRVFDTTFEVASTGDEWARMSSFRPHTDPATFPLDGVVTGFKELLTGAKAGETRAAALPPAKAYGEQGQHPLAGRTLVFQVDVLEVEN